MKLGNKIDSKKIINVGAYSLRYPSGTIDKNVYDKKWTFSKEIFKKYFYDFEILHGNFENLAPDDFMSEIIELLQSEVERETRK